MQCAATGPEVKQAETLFFHLALGDAAHNMLFARAIEDALSELFLPFPSGAGGGGSQAAAWTIRGAVGSAGGRGCRRKPRRDPRYSRRLLAAGAPGVEPRSLTGRHLYGLITGGPKGRG